MKQDKYGRWFMDGTEDKPGDLKCLRCGRVPYTSGNPYGTYIFTFTRGDKPGAQAGFAVCDPCAVDLWEYLTPGLTDNPGYIAAKDQHQAAVPDYRKQWNERACEHEQIEGDDGCAD